MDASAVDELLASNAFDCVVSTAGCVDNDARSDFDGTNFCRIFANIAGASERHLHRPDLRAIFIAGLTALCMPGIAPPITLQESLIGNKYPQYNAHLLNHQRLVQSSLDWSLYCPGAAWWTRLHGMMTGR